VVKLEDGSEKTFGERTVESLLETAEDNVEKWIGKLEFWALKGLLHELNPQMMKENQRYFAKKKEVEETCDKQHYKYFGLSDSATEKEINNAYRKRAREMHPDKNGGTEAAKERFQVMKDKYEALKQHFRRASAASEVSTCCSDSAVSSDDAGEKRQSKKSAEGKPDSQCGDDTSGDNPATGKQATPGAGPSDESMGQKENGQEHGHAAEKDEPRAERRPESYDEDEVLTPNAEGQRATQRGRGSHGSIKMDSESREELEEAAWFMIRQLKAIRHNEAILEAQLRQANA
jgi:curved DNA-binding protein CbpA